MDASLTKSRLLDRAARVVLGLIATGFLVADVLGGGYLAGPAERYDGGTCIGGQNLKLIVLVALPAGALLAAFVPVSYRRPWMRSAIMTCLLGAYVVVLLTTQGGGPQPGEC